MQLNKKAFTLIELLVVIVLIGITSLVAIPNVREFIINKEYKNDVYKIATIANSLRNDLETKKADITSTLPYELAFFIFSYAENNIANGVQINIGKADSNRLQNFKNIICDINQRNNLSFWNQVISYNYITDRNIQSNVNETFRNLRLGVNSGPGWACYSTDMSQNFNRIWFDRYNGGPIGICHVSKMAPGANRCTPSTDNSPYYGISITKFGRAAIHKYDYATATWKEEQN